MKDMEQQIIKNIAEVLPTMNECQKNYLLGLGEGMVMMKKRKDESQKEAG